MDFIGYLSDMDSTTYLLYYDLIIMVVISILILYVIWLFLGWKELNYYLCDCFLNCYVLITDYLPNRVRRI